MNAETVAHQNGAAPEASLMADVRGELILNSSTVFMVGNSPVMLEVFDQIRKFAACDVPVLITGESGTGKELVARTVHDLSPRRLGPFVPINCAALPETLIESELFGHEKGSFTGASERRPGCFELAQNGTLLLDEISELEQQLAAVGGVGVLPGAILESFPRCLYGFIDISRAGFVDLAECVAG